MSRYSVCLLSLPLLVCGHTIMSKPTPRENSVHVNGGYECGKSTSIQATYTRGQVIDLQWGRNNHHAGFTQISVLPLSGNDASQPLAAFDDAKNIIHVSCYNQPSCKASGGGDNFGLGGDGTDFQVKMCNTKLTIPTWLGDGNYVMKMAIFGNGDSFGVRNMPHPAYLNCHNFKVSGGTAITTQAANNGHIEWGAGNAGLQDYALEKFNSKYGTTVSTKQCMFSGTITHMGCTPSGKRSPKCVGEIADISRCGSTTADTRATCLGFNNEGQTEGGDLYNYMAGVPAYHPSYTGTFQKLSHVAPHAKNVTLASGGTNTGGTDKKSNGEKCALTSECEATLTCFEKDQYWSGCGKSCVPGVHLEDPVQYRTPWTCKVQGVAAPTAGAAPTSAAGKPPSAAPAPTSASRTCADQSPSCGGWAAQKYCAGPFADFMTSVCPSSCSKCDTTVECVDRSPECGKWSGLGYCVGQYADFMAGSCKKTCKKCFAVSSYMVSCGGQLTDSCSGCHEDACFVSCEWKDGKCSAIGDVAALLASPPGLATPATNAAVSFPCFSGAAVAVALLFSSLATII